MRRSQRRLTKKDVIEIRKKYIPYEYPISRLSKEYSVSPSSLRDILAFRTWNPEKFNSHYHNEKRARYNVKRKLRDLLIRDFLPVAKDEEELNLWINRANKRISSDEVNPYSKK